MQARFISILFFLIFISLNLQSQDLKKQYIAKHKSEAVKKMIDYGIPASIILAQAILESGAGQSKLAQKANNHFGIKCHSTWKGKTFTMDDDTKNECFRKYKSANQSFEDHSIFLTSRDRYAFLFEYDVTDYKSWAYGLKKAGYATNPQYAQMLIKVIKDNQLYRFDKSGKKKNRKETEQTIAYSKTKSKYPEYSSEKTEDFQPVSVSKSNRIIYETNGIRYVLALQQDSWKVIADEFGFYTKQILDFNSANRKTVLSSGDRVYIKKKKRKAEVMFHIVQQGETLQSISQIYAVRTKNIKKRNNIKRKDTLIAGQRLKLR